MALEQMNPPGNFADVRVPIEAPSPHDGGFFVPPEGVSRWLPPLEYQKRPSEPIPTPVDDRGLIDIPALFETVKSTVEPEYSWPRGRRNESTHHFYYEEADYPFQQIEGRFSPGVFRNLPIHKGELPRVFENWLHLVMEKPLKPTPEVMQYRIEAWQVAVNLFESAREVIQWERRAPRRAEYIAKNPAVIGNNPAGDVYGKQCIAETIDRHFTGVEKHMHLLEQVPPEFRFIEPVSTPEELAAILGRIVIPRSLRLGRLIQNTSAEQIAA